MKLIADSGSTKTAWVLTDGNSHRFLQTQGVNPFQQSDEEIFALLEKELVPGVDVGTVSEMFFYGAGCTKEQALRVQSVLSRLFRSAKVFVGSDMLGAARALCGHEAGIVCILGTGSNSCYYDGQTIRHNVAPLGFILGDEGSGAYIGRRLVGNCLKQQFSPKICRMFRQETALSMAEIIQRVYREPLPNRFLASLSPFCARHRRMREIHDFLLNCFSEFFVRNVALYKRPDLPVHFAGSVAWHYRREVTEAAQAQSLCVGRFMQNPLDGLLHYHSNI